MALIDFGLCAEVPLPDTKNMTLAIVHLMQGDVPGLLEDAIELGFLPQDVNKETLQPGILYSEHYRVTQIKIRYFKWLYL